MKAVVYLAPARKALRKHRNMAERIMAKIDDYAKNPAAFANATTEFRGRPDKRLKIGDFRVLFVETDNQIIIADIGPRGDIYE